MPQVRRLGSYAPLSSTYYLDDAVIEAGADAELLFARSLAFCASVPSDGYFTDGQLQRFAAGLTRVAKRTDVLVKSGLWERTPGGYVIRSWLKWNKSAAEREREKSKDRERKAAQSPGGFQPELGTESAENPNGNGTGIPSRARAGGALQSTTHHTTSRHGTDPPSQPADHDDSQRQADQLLDSTGPWTAALRADLHGHVAEALTNFEPAGIKAALADYRTKLGDDRTRPGLLPYLIQQHAARLEPAKATRPPWCGNCEEATRLVLDENRDPVGPCPECRPLTRGRGSPVASKGASS